MKKIMRLLVLMLGVSMGLVPVAYASGTETPTSQPLYYFMQGDKVAPSTTPYGNNPSMGHYVQAEDARLYYEIYTPEEYTSSTPTVVLLHGGGVGTPFELGDMIDDLRKAYRVVVVSTRGHGRSEIGHTPITYEQKANDVLAIMREVTDRPVIIVGFSDGAYTAYKVAGMYPAMVERIVAIGAGTLERGYFHGDMLISDLEKIDARFVAQQKAIMPEPERWQEFCTNYMHFWSTMEVGGDLLSSIQCPVLLIAGDEDDHAPILTMLKAHQLIPNSRLCILPKAWHTAFLDQYDVMWRAMQPFLSEKIEDVQSSAKVSYNNSVF